MLSPRARTNLSSVGPWLRLVGSFPVEKAAVVLEAVVVVAVAALVQVDTAALALGAS